VCECVGVCVHVCVGMHVCAGVCGCMCACMGMCMWVAVCVRADVCVKLCHYFMLYTGARDNESTAIFNKGDLVLPMNYASLDK
jgi:hypothetical protein